jgi:hypothetical protein
LLRFLLVRVGQVPTGAGRRILLSRRLTLPDHGEDLRPRAHRILRYDARVNPGAGLMAAMRSGGPRGRRTRSLVARVLIVALLLPAVFALGAPDPHWFLGVGEAERPAGHRHAEGAPAHEHRHSEIPGADGHPADHNCSPCQVLKYLAIYLPQRPLALAGAAPADFAPVARPAPQRTGHLASLPPSRAPPVAA